jgi:histidinol-phosphatase
MNNFDLQVALDTAKEAVKAASAASLSYFRKRNTITLKADHSLATLADRDAEDAILATIRRRFPEHAILTEETGAYPGSLCSRWIVDPLDGTRGFLRGGDFWGPLVALEHKGVVVAGAMALPALQRTYWAAQGLGSFADGAPLRVSTVSTWEAATLSVGELRTFLRAPAQRDSLVRLTSQAAQTRCYGDLAACAMLLEGKADAWIETGIKPWDVAALKILVEEAGGVFTDFKGVPTISSGNAIATNGLLHEHLVRELTRNVRNRGMRASHGRMTLPVGP